MVVCLFALTLSYACDDLYELAISIALHFNTVERVLFNIGLATNLLSAWAGEHRLLLLAAAGSWRVIPREASSLLYILVIRVHALLYLRLIIGEQVVHVVIRQSRCTISLVARLNHIAVIGEWVRSLVIIIVWGLTSKIKEVFILSTSAKTNKQNSIKCHFDLLTCSLFSEN